MNTWKTSPLSFRDSELVRMVLSDPTSTALERNLALRLDRLLYKLDGMEMDVENAETAARVTWEQLELFPKNAS